MKVILPNYPLVDSFVDNVAYTLKSMGVEVITPNRLIGVSKNKYVNAARQMFDQLFPKNWTASEKWAVHAAKQVGGADLLLWLTKSLRQEVLEEVRKLGVQRCVAWWGDSPANIQKLDLLSDNWDRIFIKDAAAVDKFRAVGLPAELLHEACNPVWHTRLFRAISDDIVVAGNYYGYRQFLAGRLLDAGERLALYGPPAPSWATDAIKSAHRGRYITKEQKSKIFGSGIACLNSTALSEGNSLNCRAFEIAGACGLQLIEDKPIVADCFEPGKEVLAYRSVDEIIETLSRVRKDSDWAMSIREAGHKRAHAEHTYEHRLQHIMKSVDMSVSGPGGQI